jgi:hypothetical protein
VNKSEDNEATWTPEDVGRYLRLPVATLYRWRYIGVARRLPGSGSTCAICPQTCAPGFMSSRARRDA